MQLLGLLVILVTTWPAFLVSSRVVHFSSLTSLLCCSLCELIRRPSRLHLVTFRFQCHCAQAVLELPVCAQLRTSCRAANLMA
eukprot:1141847-Pelagomonas_calceolata.AAC.2